MIPPSNQTLPQLHSDARRIFTRALQASSIQAAFGKHLEFENGMLVGNPADGGTALVPIERFDGVYAIALGKAATPMLKALLERIPPHIAVSGVCCAPSLPHRRHPGIRYYAGGHPSPNRDSFRSAQAALRLLGSARENSFIFFLISGGGSAMFELPLDQEISLGDTVVFHRALVGSGASIAEINSVRKHFSAVKGGRLAMAAPEAEKLSLLISDVPDRQLDALSSGPTLPDSSSVEECREVLARYRLLDRFPPSIRAFFLRPDLQETPGMKVPKPKDPSRPQKPEAFRMDEHLAGFPRSEARLLLSNRDLVNAARDEAESRGWRVEIDNTCDDWDFREAASYLLNRMRELRREHPRVCLLSGGEVTVRLNDSPGTGGRNQQFALACALELADAHGASQPSRDELAPETTSSVAILSAGSDGIDGNSPAAGAVADATTVSRALERGFDAKSALLKFDCFPFFTALGDTVMTGPTHNNLRDLRILLSC